MVHLRFKFPHMFLGFWMIFFTEWASNNSPLTSSGHVFFNQVPCKCYMAVRTWTLDNLVGTLLLVVLKDLKQ